MIRKVHTRLEDDLDGGKASETISFGLDGTRYQIDLNSTNASKLRRAFAPYVTAARRVRRGGARARSGARRPAKVTATSVVDPAAVRAWAAANRITVAARGRISAQIIEQYRAAGN